MQVELIPAGKHTAPAGGPLGALLLAGALLCGGCWLSLRPRMRTWGATPVEVARPLPGDALVPAPKLVTTRAITIHTPVAAVWPWLVQLGQSRGGLYTYDWLENRFGLQMESADEIHPEWQALDVGDSISLAPHNAMPLTVVTLVPQQVLVLGARVDTTSGHPFAPSAPRPAAYLLVSWAFVLTAVDAETTRLIVRCRLDWNRSLANTILWQGLTAPAQFAMERKMLQGIRERAEGLVWDWLAPPEPPRSPTPGQS